MKRSGVCPKCGGDGRGTPCAYPDFNFRDCEHPDRLATRALVLADAIRPLLAGNDPAAQGGALGDLVATFLLGHAPALRKRMLTLHVELVSSLVAHAVKGGHDPWRRKRKPGT